MYCTKCGQKLDDDAKFCTRCGTPISSNCIEAEDKEKQNLPDTDALPSVALDNGTRFVNDAEVNKPRKSKVAAALLAFFFGIIGVHNFYLGKYKLAIPQAILGGLFILLEIINSILLFTVNDWILNGNVIMSTFYSLFGGIAGIWAFIDFIMILTSKELK